MPREGKAKAPDTPDNPRVNARLKSAGAAVGCDFTGKCDRYPNTINAHILTEVATEAGKSDQVAETMFQYNFRDGLDCSVRENLLKAARDNGLDVAAVERALDDPQAPERVTQKAREWGRKGIRGVPFFIFNDQPGFSGAQEVGTFLQAFDDATR
eukprot:Hpha_TRINITY_DN30751_c0_g1::TRINITY_DN30751_c0_g1_i1::g.28381::m.28381